MDLWQTCVDGDKGRGHSGLFNWQTGTEAKTAQGFYGFIYPPLIKQLWQRPGSDKGRGQVWFSDQLSACQTITAAGLKAARCLSAGRTSQHREGGGFDWHQTQKSCSFRRKLGWLHRIVTHNGVMSLVLMYVNQRKLTTPLDPASESQSESELFLSSSRECHFYFFLLQNKIIKHLSDPACENSFRLNVMNLTQRWDNNNNTRMNYYKI